MANQYLSLALFLMLLSFFIVMNAVSDFEDSKSKPVMNSLALAFSNQTIEQEMAPVIAPNTELILHEGDTLESLEGLFNAHIAGFQATKNRFGTVMHVRTPLVQFESAIDIEDTDFKDVSVGDRGAFIQSMVTLLRSEKKKMPFRVDMVLNISQDPAIFQKMSPNDFSENLKRVSSFAEKLEGFGLPKKMMSAGLGQGETGFIDLYFYRYKPFDVLAKIESEASKNGGLK